MELRGGAGSDGASASPDTEAGGGTLKGGVNGGSDTAEGVINPARLRARSGGKGSVDGDGADVANHVAGRCEEDEASQVMWAVTYRAGGGAHWQG